MREPVTAILGDTAQSIEVRSLTLAALGPIATSRGSRRMVLADYGRFEPDLQPQAIVLLTERAEWAHALLDAIGRQEIPAAALTSIRFANCWIARMRALAEKVQAQWGTLRTDRNPQREKVIADVRGCSPARRAMPRPAQVVFNRVCGQCHKIYGRGKRSAPT